jgi:hypothetical protein
VCPWQKGNRKAGAVLGSDRPITERPSYFFFAFLAFLAAFFAFLAIVPPEGVWLRLMATSDEGLRV